MIYLNNSATSYPKPACVLEAVERAVSGPPAGQFRGGGMQETEDLFSSCRELLGEILGIRETERIFFSSGATDSLNALFSGLGLTAENVITTATEHNSVLRPLYNRGNAGCGPVIVPCDENGFVDPESIREAAAHFPAKERRAIVLNHCSNVTGAIQDAAAVGAIAGEYGFLFVLDCAQSAGCVPVQTDKWGVDALAFTGHKSLLGLQGTGGYYVRKDLPFIPARFGGTGRDSRKLVYSPDDYEYEPGTQNSPGIAALKAGCGWILSHGIGEIASRESGLRAFLAGELEKLPGVRVLGAHPEQGRRYGPVLSFTVKGLKSADVSYILQNSYEIVTRAGLMCAPLIHPFLKTGEDGTVRVSFSPFTEKADLAVLTDALREILSALGGSEDAR